MSETDDFPCTLVYISEETAGFRRRRQGRGFIYLDPAGNKITDEGVLARIRQLVIPPMWTNVWICENERGHLQATGEDQRKRKQYIYHPLWIRYRQKSKYDKLSRFGRKLPVIRKQVQKHLAMRGWPKERILALTVRMLDRYLIRIGNRYYKKENNTYGLTTLRRKHIHEEEGLFFIRFQAKSGKERRLKIENRRLITLIKKVSELPGYEIFKYVDAQGGIQKIDSHDVNEYLESLTGEPFTAKDFRTWGGTVLAVEHYPHAQMMVSKNSRLSLETTIVKKVAESLANTVAICREYYIHPAVMQALIDDRLADYRKKKLKGLRYRDLLTENEQLVLKVIDNQ